MRKVDYDLLADILSAEIHHAKSEMTKAGRTFDTHAVVRYDAQRITAERIAEVFAKRASVNKAAFLIACGIMPT